jgi:hypothetical protein
MSPAAPDHTETDSSMMLAAAKPATPRRLRNSRSVETALSEVPSDSSAAVKPARANASTKSAALAPVEPCTTVTRLADRLVRALATPGIAVRAASTLRMQPPQCMFSTARVVVAAR